MDEFHQLWPLMADHQRSTDVYFELLSLQKSHSGTNESSNPLGSGPLNLTGATLEYMKCHLVSNMYPTVQVLQLIPASLAIDVSWKAVQHITNVLNRSPDADLNRKLINLLVHTDWPEKYVHSINRLVLPVLAKYRNSNDGIDYWTRWIANSHNDQRMIKRFLDYLKIETRYLPNSIEEIFMNATQNVHFLEKLIYRKNKITISEEVPLQIRSLIYLIQLINVLESIPFCDDNLERVLQLDSTFTSHGFVRALYLEVKRVFILQSRLNFHLPRLDITSFAKTFNVIDFMTSNLTLDAINYIRIEPILRENQAINRELFDYQEPHDQSCTSELELYDQFTVIRTFRSVICGSHDIANQIAVCKRSFRSIETLKGFCVTLECCVALLFLRWDHLTHIEPDQTIESGTEESDKHMVRQIPTDTEIELRANNIKYEKQGFVCNVDNLSLILKTLRQAIAKRRHSDEFPNHSTEDLQRFEAVADIISDTNWRLNLLRKKDSDVSNHMVVDIKKYMITYNRDQKIKSSSTDDDSDVIEKKERRRKSDRWSDTFPRRKPKKRVPFGKGDSSRQLSFCHSTENERRKSIEIGGIGKCAHSSEESDGPEVNVCMWSQRSRTEGRKCVMSKMLGSKEHLMTVCMNQGDLKGTRQMIKVHSLCNSHVSAELDFSENFNQTKEKLRQIFVRYRCQIDDQETPNDPIQEDTTNYESQNTSFNSKSTVNRIQKVAALGFEASKITNILARYATEHVVYIPNSDEIQNVLLKFDTKYTFLSQFKPNHSLQATIICDLAISLAPNHEIAFNMFNVLTKLWSTSDANPKDSSQPEYGYMKFLPNLVDSVQIVSTKSGKVVSCLSFLSDSILTTNRALLVNNLARKDTLCKLYETPSTEYATPEKLKLMVTSFAELNRIPSETNNILTRVVQFLGNMVKLLQFNHMESNIKSTNELLQLNLRSEIGKLIFDKAVCPNDLESITCSVHLNMLYEIALNLSAPILSVQRDSDKTSMEQLLQNVENQNHDTMLIRGEFVCQNAIVFDYVSKHCPLLGYLLQNITTQKAVDVFGFEMNFIENMFKVEQFGVLSNMYERNTLWTLLSYDNITEGSVASFVSRTQDKQTALNAIRSIKCQYRLRNRASTNYLQTWLIQGILAKSTDNSYNYTLIEHIGDINTKAKCLLDNILHIGDYTTCVRMIRSTLLAKSRNRLHQELKNHLNQWLHHINVYAQIAMHFNACRRQQRIYRWRDIMQMSSTKPENVLEVLLNVHDYSLCLEWSGIHPLEKIQEKLQQIATIFSTTVKQMNGVNPKIFQLLETLPRTIFIDIYVDLIKTVKCLTILRYLVDYLLSVEERVERKTVERINISLTIFEMSDSPLPWHLIHSPMLIIEQYLMNSRFEALAKIIQRLRSTLTPEACVYCSENRGNFNSPMLDTISHSFSDEYVGDFNQHQQQHVFGVNCIDSLLRIYATKALDFRVIESHTSSDDLHSHTTNQTTGSIDSLLLNAFIMPRDAPTRSNWVRDDEATHCMSCRKAVFTMLTRRHHCRQCGRVVCHACSTKRALIPSLYADVRVRVCDDCHRQLDLNEMKVTNNSGSTTTGTSTPSRTSTPHTRLNSTTDADEWAFSGNVRHDELLREEFSYVFAPSVSLCLSILALHSTTGPECANFLLLHCSKFESLLRPLQPGHPNPEIDYVMVTRMLHCLALAAKVRGGPPECDIELEHAEIIRSVVQHRCETLLPMESLNQSSFRKLRDSLVLAEKWNLALEVSLKRGFPTTGVMAAWGIACLKSGCFDTAREKFSHCLTRVGSENDIFKVFTVISYESTFQTNKPTDLPSVKRPVKSPPLLAEIIHILEQTCHPMQPAVMARANVIRESKTSLISLSNRSKRVASDEVLCNEPSLSILHTLSNLKHIAYDAIQEPRPNKLLNNTSIAIISSRMVPNSRFYDECLYYLTSYANHSDILVFLAKHKQIRTALKYVHYQNVEADLFIRSFFMPYLRKGQSSQLVQQMIELDETLLIWKPFIIPLCAHLERCGLLNCLYLLQMLFKDPVRASMTCVRFYEHNCQTYSHLLAQSFHLVNAEMHLTKELDICQWQEIRVGRRACKSSASADGARTPIEQRSLLMKMDSKTLNSHINTIARQMEVTKFLANCETAGRDTVKHLPKIFMQSTSLPTLFGSTKDKIQVTILVLICGSNVTEGYGLAFRIIHDFHLDAESIYTSVVKHLAGNRQLHGVDQLIDCIRGNSVGTTHDDCMCDRILGVAVEVFCSHGFVVSSDIAERELLERLVKQVNDVAIRINCHIASGQLKSAYLLAVQYEREADIRRVWRKAEKTSQTHIRKLCERKLNIHPL